ncbi:MAG: N-acetyltransferase family protein [Frankiaceae bacterium]
MITRVVTPSDYDRITRMWPRLSRQTIYRRFHAPLHQFPAGPVRRFVAADHEMRDAVVAVLDEEIIGIARYERLADEPSAAEFAVVVQDNFQRTGLGWRLLDEVLELARTRGIAWMTGSVVADNKPMLDLLRQRLPQVQLHLTEGIYQVRIPLGAGCRLGDCADDSP